LGAAQKVALTCEIDCGARRTPPYRMWHSPPHPAPSRLHAQSDEAVRVFQRLRDMLAIKTYPEPPGTYQGEPALFHQRGLAWWHPVRWMPQLRPGWRRLTFREVVEFYGLPESS